MSPDKMPSHIHLKSYLRTWCSYATDKLKYLLVPITLQLESSRGILEVLSFERRPYVSGGVFGIY